MFLTFNYKGLYIHNSIVNGVEKTKVQDGYTIYKVTSILAAKRLISKLLKRGES